MSFPANGVEQAMLEASNDQRRMGHLIAQMRAGQLWVPVTGDPNDGKPVKLYTIDIEQRPHALVFTSQEQLDKWGPGTPHVVAPTMSFVQTLPATVGLAVNPGGDLGLPLAPDSVADLGPSERTLPAGTRLRIGDPAVEPVEVLSQVAYALGEVSDVLGARRAWVQAGDSLPSLTIGLSLVPGAAAEQVLPSVRDALDEVLRHRQRGFAIDLVVLDGAPDPIGSWMQQHAPPFYLAP